MRRRACPALTPAGFGCGISVAALDLCLTARAWLKSEDCLVALRMIQRRQADGVLHGAVVGLRDLPIELWASIEDAVLGEAYVAARRARRETRYHEDDEPCYCISFGKQEACVLSELIDCYPRWPAPDGPVPSSDDRLNFLTTLWSDYLRDLSEFAAVRDWPTRVSLSL